MGLLVAYNFDAILLLAVRPALASYVVYRLSIHGARP